MYVPSQQMGADMRRWEGSSLKVYGDSRNPPLPTQGVGRHHGVNWGDPDITPDTEALWLAEDLQTGYSDALTLFPNLDGFDLVRKEALISVAFNMGLEKLSQFVPFIEHVNAEEWDEAAYHLMVNMKHHLTPYLLEVGARAEETALRICSGNILGEFAL